MRRDVTDCQTTRRLKHERFVAVKDVDVEERMTKPQPGLVCSLAKMKQVAAEPL